MALTLPPAAAKSLARKLGHLFNSFKPFAAALFCRLHLFLPVTGFCG
jgi:hypothetical protein